MALQVCRMEKREREDCKTVGTPCLCSTPQLLPHAVRGNPKEKPHTLYRTAPTALAFGAMPPWGKRKHWPLCWRDQTTSSLPYHCHILWMARASTASMHLSSQVGSYTCKQCSCRACKVSPALNPAWGSAGLQALQAWQQQLPCRAARIGQEPVVTCWGELPESLQQQC